MVLDISAGFAPSRVGFYVCLVGLHSLRLSLLRDVAIDLVVRDRSPHIPSRVTADEHRQQLCRGGQTRIYRCEFLTGRSTPIKGLCCLPEGELRSQHPRFRTSWTCREGSPIADLATGIEQPGEWLLYGLLDQIVNGSRSDGLKPPGWRSLPGLGTRNTSVACSASAR